MNRYKNFPEVITITYDNHKTIHDYKNYYIWIWIVRISLIFIYSPFIFIPLIIYALFFYGLSKTKQDLRNSKEMGSDIKESGTLGWWSSDKKIEILRNDSKEQLDNIVRWPLVKKLGKISFFVVCAFAISFIVIAVFVLPRVDGVGEYNNLCSHIVMDGNNEKLLSINEEIDSEIKFCSQANITKYSTLYEVSIEYNLDFISLVNIYTQGSSELKQTLAGLDLSVAQINEIMQTLEESRNN